MYSTSYTAVETAALKNEGIPFVLRDTGTKCFWATGCGCDLLLIKKLLAKNKALRPVSTQPLACGKAIRLKDGARCTNDQYDAAIMGDVGKHV